MKHLAKISSIICFVLLLTSCEKDSEKINTQTLTESTSDFKGEDDDTILVLAVPTLHENIYISPYQSSSEFIVYLIGTNVSYSSNTLPDAEGDFYFYNLIPGSYVRNIYLGGILSSSQSYEVDY